MNTPVSFELEKLLLDKGIDFPVSVTIAEVVMWLYEKHNVWIWVEPFITDTQYYCQAFIKINQKESETVLTGKHKHTPSAFSNIKEAYEAAIQYVLQTIKCV